MKNLIIMKNKIKELTAHIDLNTGKIYGCKKFSWKWLHEKGHKEFNDDETKSFLLLLKGYSLDLSIMFIILAFFQRAWLSVAIVLYFIFIYISLYEEWWCNRYANKRFK